MLYNDWINQIKPEKRARTYQHIDDTLDLANNKISQKVIDVLKDINNHQFLPFIKRTEVKVRFRRKKGEKVVRSQKLRPIMYASHIDSHIYSYYNFILMKRYEEYAEKLGFSESAIAYRKIKIDNMDRGKSNIHFAKEVFDYIKDQGDCIVITQDIEKFFDTLNHKFLKEKICKVLDVDKLNQDFFKVFKSLTAYKYIEYSDFIDKKIKKKTKVNKYAIYKILKGIVNENNTNKGIPQGSPISGLLANIYLIDFDIQIKSAFPDIFYRRYSDDLVFVIPKDKKNELLEFITNNIKESLLDINAGKSFISYFKKSGSQVACDYVTNGLDIPVGRKYVDYLGLEFDGKSILLRKNTIQKLKHKQIKKTARQLLNTQVQKRRKPKKHKNKQIKSKNNYFKRTLKVVNDVGIKNQILKVTRDRNRVKSLNVNKN